MNLGSLDIFSDDFGPAWKYKVTKEHQELYLEWFKSDIGQEIYKKTYAIFSGYEPEIVEKVVDSITTDRTLVARIITDEDFIRQIKPWFRDITCDGGRANTTLNIIYTCAKSMIDDFSRPFVSIDSTDINI